MERLMSIYVLRAMIVILGFLAIYAEATTRYVDINGANPVSPYLTWPTAATNIQDALDSASPGDLILVTNGVYATGGRNWFESGTNRVTLTNSVTLQSVNGPAVTLIVGSHVPPGTNVIFAVRCVGMGNGAVLSGFTLTNGEAGGGNYPNGGGVAYIYGSSGGIVTNCILAGNLNTNNAGGGAYGVTLVNCQLIGNYARSGGGACACTLNDCIIENNTAVNGGGTYGGGITNCTIASNTATTQGGGIYGAGGISVYNSIIYDNNSPNGSNSFSAKFFSCCTAPNFPGSGISNDPVFVNLTAGDYHLAPFSPCINAGNNAYAAISHDLDGNPRIINGTVDIGAYESPYNVQTVHYVSLNSTNPISPYNSWSIAATNLQSAVDAATNGDFIWVTNGLYNTGGRTEGGYTLTNRVAVTKPITIQSVNGPSVTAIQGKAPVGSTAIRCVYLTNGAALYGFTLTNGATLGSENDPYGGNGGGLLCETRAVASNCVIVGCSAYNGGGAEGGTLNDCTILRNSASYSGGGAFGRQQYIGGISNMLINCLISSNIAYLGGGAGYSVLNGCIIASNTAPASEAGGVAYSTLTNCLLTANQAADGGGAFYSTLFNCTVAGNLANYGGGTYESGNDNCIVYDNRSAFGGPNSNYESSAFSYCDTTPLPSGIDNLTNDPAFINPASGDYHLQSLSPCINSGNNSYITSVIDLDGHPRIQGGTVDIGAYEYQTPTSVISYAWLQQYGLPTDGSVDYTNLDGTSFNVYQDWIAGLDPTNPASVLAMTTPNAATNNSGITVTWQSVNGIVYNLQRSTNLPVFITVQANIPGVGSSTSYNDTTATNNGPYFYRIGVQ
ncbi:MAG TPA: choice-of-anchor Q domain-containing protein [Verrucomicrobiae bacterium]